MRQLPDIRGALQLPIGGLFCQKEILASTVSCVRAGEEAYDDQGLSMLLVESDAGEIEVVRAVPICGDIVGAPHAKQQVIEFGRIFLLTLQTTLFFLVEGGGYGRRQPRKAPPRDRQPLGRRLIGVAQPVATAYVHSIAALITREG